MITFTNLLEATYKNQKHFSKRGEVERRALHSQFRQLNKTDDAAANSNPRPKTAEDIANLEKWAKSREKDSSFKSLVDQAKFEITSFKQKNKPKIVKESTSRLHVASNNNEIYYKLYDFGDRQVYNEAGKFKNAKEAFHKLSQLYQKDSDAYGDLGVIKYEGPNVYHITEKLGKFYKSKM